MSSFVAPSLARFCLANTLAIVFLVPVAVPLIAQSTGRTMRLLAPVVLGQTATFGMTYPGAAAGNPYAFLWCMPPFAGTQTLTVPGFTVQGQLLVSAANSVTAYAGVLGGAGSVVHSLVVPGNPSFLGMAWDLQSLDLALGASVVSLADNELSVAVTGGPPPSLHMIPIAPGTFHMGSVAAGATPVHTVTISRPFWIGRDEVTQAQYQAVMGNNPSTFQGAAWPNAAQRPVEQVSWLNAVAYCAALSAQEAAAGRLPSGYVYRLPTEAEWEYCCRAGTTTEWNVGPSLICGQANFLSDSFGFCQLAVATAVVGSYAPNAWGLRDMHGNVFEWCLDAYAAYPAGPVTDPYVPGTSGSTRAFRGGSWGNNFTVLRSAQRNHFAPVFRAEYWGFRVVCAPILP